MIWLTSVNDQLRQQCTKENLIYENKCAFRWKSLQKLKKSWLSKIIKLIYEYSNDFWYNKSNFYWYKYQMVIVYDRQIILLIKLLWY